MTMRRFAPVMLTIVFAASAGPVRAQERVVIETQPTGGEPMMIPGFGGQRQMKTGTGRILGRVLASDSGSPIRRALVRLTAPEIGVKTALTDAEGRFEFRELPGGRFTLNASKSGYVNVQYGQTRPFEQGRPIELSDKQVLDKTDISMPRGGVISGRLTDEFGDPVPDAMVGAMRQTWSNGRRRLTPTGRTSQTNDLGQYRMYGLPPGEYYVSATLRNTDIMILDAAMLGGGASGASGSTPSSGYAPTYFPGTTIAAGAQRVTVAIAQEAQNTDFALAPVRLARISGAVMTSEGKPLEGAMVSAVPAGRADVGMGMMNAGTSRTTKDGSFTLSSVAPGDYMLTVRSVRIMTSSDGGDTMMFRATIGGGGDGGDGEAASLPLAVSGEDLSNVVIVTSKGATASGRIVFEGSSTPPALTGVRITAAPADMDNPLLGGGGAATAKEDGSFQLRGLSGRSLLRAGNLPPGWTLKAVRLNGDDVTDSGVEFKPGQDVSGLEIVATSKQTEISGTVTSSNGSAIKEYTVVVFSDDSQHWNLPMTRWVTGTRPDQEGRFRVRNMPPGSYNIIAVDYIEAGSWADPELLERLKGRARRITLADGGTEKLDLKLTDQF
jgi:protocatechuate 3,4-dioxygenase beta subunit